MKVKDGFVMKDVMGKTLVVPVGQTGEALRAVIKLNGTGKRIWELIAEGKTEEETAAALTEEYEVSREKALSDVVRMVEMMKKARVFEEESRNEG